MNNQFFINFDPNDQIEVIVRVGNATVENYKIPILFGRNTLEQFISVAYKDTRPIQMEMISIEWNDKGKKLYNRLIYSNQVWLKNFESEENNDKNS